MKNERGKKIMNISEIKSFIEGIDDVSILNEIKNSYKIANSNVAKKVKDSLSIGDKVEIVVDCKVKGDIAVVEKINRKYINVRMISGNEHGEKYRVSVDCVKMKLT
jgi:uncharacterized Zn ribbon protein|tara:strand:+ start:5853 stop:6170 length:318 start_codon:yes stop_codon:yes gene_type:complete